MREISYVSIVLFIACGALVSLILFLFVKRQITRFTIRASRIPHSAIGADAPFALKQEIESRLRRVADIKVEPKLLCQKYTEALKTGEKDTHFLYRMKAMDSLTSLDQEIRYYDRTLVRKPGQNLRYYLTTLQSGPLKGIKTDLIHDFADVYEHARHDPAEFGKREFEHYMELLEDLINHVSTYIQSRRNSLASSKSATSQTALIASRNFSHQSSVKYRSNHPEEVNFGSKQRLTLDDEEI
ncbi:protein C1orf43 homolog [Tubulanus polymorphus]|uniref:protein C1orf43 homolog n=1 Tax=Tubulanus polymorphus TaxID=672921 RepID=UPI003DA3FF4D